MEVNSHRIWNYHGDHYVHHIIQTKLGGNESHIKYEEMEAEVLGQATRDQKNSIMPTVFDVETSFNQ